MSMDGPVVVGDAAADSESTCLAALSTAPVEFSSGEGEGVASGDSEDGLTVLAGSANMI